MGYPTIQFLSSAVPNGTAYNDDLPSYRLLVPTGLGILFELASRELRKQMSQRDRLFSRLWILACRRYAPVAERIDSLPPSFICDLYHTVWFQVFFQFWKVSLRSLQISRPPTGSIFQCTHWWVLQFMALCISAQVIDKMFGNALRVRSAEVPK